MNRYLPHRSTLMSLRANRVAMAAYLAMLVIGLLPILQYLAWLVPLLLFLAESESGLVRFHAFQAFLLGILYQVLSGMLGVLGVISAALAAFSPFLTLPRFLAPLSWGFTGGLVILWGILGIAYLVFVILGTVSAARWEERSLPLLGFLTRKILSHASPAKVGPEGSGRETQQDPLQYQGGIPRQVHRRTRGNPPVRLSSRWF